MATPPTVSGFPPLPAATPEKRLNFFRGSQIIVDHLSYVMRNIFQKQIENKYGPAQRWKNLPTDGARLLKNERWKEKLSQEMQRYLQGGNCERWDPTLLFHVLLHSSHCLLMDRVVGVQADLQKGSRIVKLGGAPVDVRRILRPGNVVVFDLGQTYFRTPVHSVRKAQEFQVIKPFPHNSTLADVYICKPEWQALEKLSWRRNDYFAHSQSCEMSSKDLNTLIQDVARVYSQLQVPVHVIAQMKAIGKEVIGEAQLIKEIEKYQQLWLREHAYWKKAERDIEDIHASMAGIQTDVEDLKQAVPVVASNVGSLQEDIAGLKDKNLTLHQAVDATTSAVHSTQQQLHEAKTLLSSELAATRTSISVLERQEEELTQRMKGHKERVVAELGEYDRKLSVQERQVQQIIQKHGALKTQHTSTAVRVGHQATVVHELDKRQRDSERKFTAVQKAVSTLAEEQTTLASATTAVSVQVKAMDKQLQLTVSDVDKMKTEVKVLQSTTKYEQDVRLGKLSPSFFSAEVEYYSRKCHPGTRRWIYKDMDQWVLKSASNPSRLFIITGNAGMGKSVIAATLCTKFQANGALGGCFFFQYNKPHRSNGVALVHTLAYCFCQAIPSFQHHLLPSIDKLNDSMLYSDNIAELFTMLVLEPLGRVQHRKLSNVVVVIDALDECELGSQADVLKLIVREFVKFPNWLSVIMTTRPNKRVLNKLKSVHHRLDLSPNDPRNLQDITTYLREILKDRIADIELDEAITHLVQKSEGMFLYFYYVAEVLYAQQSLTLQFIKELLPEGIDDYYDQNFQRLFKELGSHYQPLLATVIAARSGLPKTLVAVLLNCSVKSAEELISTLSVVFPVSNEVIRVLHASVKDWVTDVDNAGEYVVRVELGHQCLAQVGIQQISHLLEVCPKKEQILVDPLYHFVLEHTVFHSLAAKLPGNKLCRLFCNIQFLYYRLLLERGMTGILTDLVALVHSSSPGTETMYLRAIELFLRKYSSFLSQTPELIFQFVLNESPTVGFIMDIHSVSQQPQRVFHNLQAILQLHVTSQRMSCIMAKKETPFGVTSCKAGPSRSVVMTGISESKLLIWNWEKDELLEVSARAGVVCDVSIERQTIVCGDPFTQYDFNGVRSELVSRPDTPLFMDSALFSSSGKLILCWNISQLPYIWYSAIVWDLESGKGLIIDDTPDPSNRLISACFSPDSARILSSNASGVMNLWDVETGKKIATTEPFDTPVEGIRELQQGHNFFLIDQKLSSVPGTNADDTGSQSQMQDYPMDVQMLSKLNRTFKFQPSLSASSKRAKTYKIEKESTVLCTFSPKGHFFVASQFLQAFVWDAVSLDLVQTVQIRKLQHKDHANWITGICFSPDGHYLIAITEGGVVAWWQRNVSSLQDIAFTYHGSIEDQGHLHCCTFDSTQHLMVGSSAGMCVYDFHKLVSPGANAEPSEGKHGEYVSCCAIGSQHLYTSGAGKLTSWNNDFQEVASTSAKSGDFLCISPDKSILVTYGSELYVDVWSTDALSHVRALSPPHSTVPEYLSDRDSEANACQFVCVSARSYVICGYESGQICVFYGPVHDHKTLLEGHESDIRWIDCSSDGRTFISGDSNGIVFMWKLTEVEMNLSVSMDLLPSHSTAITEIHFSPIPGSLSRAASACHDGVLHLYHGTSGKLLNNMLPIATSDTVSKSILCFIFSPNGELLASGHDGGSCHLWDGFTGAHLSILKGDSNSVCALNFTRDSCCLASAANDMIYIWEVVSGQRLTLLPVNDVVMFLELSSITAVNPLLVCGTYDGVIHVIELVQYIRDELGTGEILS